MTANRKEARLCTKCYSRTRVRDCAKCFGPLEILTRRRFSSLAAKQEAFEESIRLKNQFRPLDEDEVDFLDAVLESNRAKENAVKQEAAEQLEAFRKQRALAEQALLDQKASDEAGKVDDPVSKNAWAKKKRRRDKENGPSGESKSRKLSTSAEDKVSTTPQRSRTPSAHPGPSLEEKKAFTLAQTGPPKAASVALGLGDYSSDEDDQLQFLG